LGVLINKPGSYQGNLRLRNDTTDGFISEVFQKEVFFYEDIQKDLTNPQLKLTAPVNHAVYPISDASISVGDEKLEMMGKSKKVLKVLVVAPLLTITIMPLILLKRADVGVALMMIWLRFTPQKDCQFVYCLEVGATPTSRQLQGGTTYNFTFTSTDILISWTVYKRDTEKVDIPGIDPDNDFQDLPQHKYKKQRGFSNRLAKHLLPKQNIRIRFVKELGEGKSKSNPNPEKKFPKTITHELAHASDKVRSHPDFNPYSTEFQ
ncbi:17565_t:CDS:2, partial [Racocetra persica]